MKSDQELDRFLDEFESALEHSKPVEGLRPAVGAAKKLLSRLQGVAENVDVEGEIAAVEALIARLDGLRPSAVNLTEMLKRGRALVELEGLVDSAVVSRAKALVERAETSKVTRAPGRGQLPTAVSVYCRECDEHLFRSGRGGQNWGTVRFRIRKHVEEAHGGVSPALKKRVMALRDQLKSGSTREEFEYFIVEAV
jgi:hypothetical protein